jgi:hypothetical protein
MLSCVAVAPGMLPVTLPRRRSHTKVLKSAVTLKERTAPTGGARGALDWQGRGWSVDGLLMDMYATCETSQPGTIMPHPPHIADMNEHAEQRCGVTGAEIVARGVELGWWHVVVPCTVFHEVRCGCVDLVHQGSTNPGRSSGSRSTRVIDWQQVAPSPAHQPLHVTQLGATQQTGPTCVGKVKPLPPGATTQQV